MTYRDKLDALHASRAEEWRSGAPWEEISERARAHKQASMLVHSLGLTADQLRAAQLHQLDPDVRDALVELSSSFDGLSRPEVLEMYSTEAALAGLQNATHGTLMELQVEELLERGMLELPDETFGGTAAVDGERGMDGWFVDADGDVVQEMQINASEDSEAFLRQLSDNPAGFAAFTAVEAAEASAGLGLSMMTDMAGRNVDLVEMGDGLSVTGAGDVLLANVPVITLGMAAFEYARNLRNGIAPEEARQLASARTGVALSYSALAWMVAAFSGIEGTRYAVVLTGEGARWVVRRLSQELEPSISHVRDQRLVLSSLAAT